MSKMAALFWFLLALLLLAICHLQAPVWFTDPATVWIVQAGILLGWLLIARFGFAVHLLAWLWPEDRQDADAERIFGALCDRHPSPFWRRRSQRLPWLLVTGQAAHVEALMPGLITERWQVSYRGIFLWCGEPGQIPDADIRWLKRRRGRRALNAVLWVTSAGDTDAREEFTQRTLWQQLKHTGLLLGWRLPVYAVVLRDDGHDQFDRPRQSTGICWTPGTNVDPVRQMETLLPGLVTEGMAQVQHNRRWSWLLQLAQDIRHAALLPLTVALQPLARAQSGVLLSGMFVMPAALPGQHAGYRDISLSPCWYGVLQQARIRQGRRDRLLFRDWLYRCVLAVIGLWCAGMLLSAFCNQRLIRENTALLAPGVPASGGAGQLRHQRELQRQLETLLWRSREGTPLQYRFGLDQNARELSRLWPVWQQRNQQLMLKPVMAQLTTRLQQYVDLPPGSPERRTQATVAYDYLKAYLMLTQPERAEPAFLNRILTPLWNAPDTHVRPGEWLMLSADMVSFYSRELPLHPGWKQTADRSLVTSVRTLLRSQKGLRNSETSLYQSVLQQAEKRHAAVSLDELLGDNAGGGLFSTEETLPGIFTREAWEQNVRSIIAEVSAGRQVTADWVLDDGKTAVSPVLSEEALRTRLTERYFTDYAGAWLTFLNSVRWQQATTLSDVTDQLSILGDRQRSPLVSLGKVLRWQADVGQEGRTAGESLISSAKQLVSGDSVPQTGSVSKPADVVTQTFAPLLAILPAEEGQQAGVSPPGGLTLEDYLLQVTQVRLVLQQVTVSDDPQGGMLALIQETLNRQDSVLSTARRRGALLAASLGQDWSGFAGAAFSEPPEQAWRSVQTPAARALNDAWQTQVVRSWQEAFSGRYPFAATESDASLPVLARFITPQSGVIEQFISQQLHGLVEKQGDEWVPVSSGPQVMAVTPAFLDAVNLLSRTGRQVFASGEARLRFDISMHPQKNVVETNLQLDNSTLKYFNQQAEWQSFTWPDPQAVHPQAVLSYTPLNRSGSAALPPVTALAFSGPWAVLRLLDKAREEQIDNSRWRMRWITPGGQTLSLILRTESYGGPLELLKLRGFRLPATVFSPMEGGE
ncbi:type VI secretion protein VasK [Salmonella enterica subsp. enterica serovar Virchow]|nr:type VI secretion protein VasK [Salmonella enterica subsp. enterica serovar Virchow]